MTPQGNTIYNIWKNKNESKCPGPWESCCCNWSKRHGKSALADAFGFIADCLEMGVEAACDANNRGRFEKLVLCYFSPNAARTLQTAAPQAYLDRIGSNINNVAQYMYRENRKDFEKVLQEIQSKLPGIEKIEPQKFENGFSKQLFVTRMQKYST